MLVIEAIAVRGKPITEPLRAAFGEDGGTIGRASTSTLFLPDAERHISRTHVKVGFDQRGFTLSDVGSFEPVLLNGRVLGHGIHAQLKDGDELTVGPYRLAVRLLAAWIQAESQTVSIRVTDAAPSVSTPALYNTATAADLPAAAQVSPGTMVSSENACQSDPAPVQEKDAPSCSVRQEIKHSPARDQIDLILKARDARVEPRLRNGWMMERAAVPSASSETGALSMYRFVSHGGALAPAPGMQPLDPVQDDGIPVLTEVWKLEDDEPAADCTGDTQHAMPAASDNPQACQPDVLAGMRAALSEVMERLAPERLQSKVEGESLLDRLLPMSRQAKQWRAFTERYREIRSRIDQESGEAFRDACEVELAKLPARVNTLPGM